MAAALMVPLSGREATISLTSWALLPSSTSASVTPEGSKGLHWMIQSYIRLRTMYLHMVTIVSCKLRLTTKLGSATQLEVPRYLA